MRAIPSIVVALLVWSTGCSSQRDSEKSAATTEHAILKALNTRDRNAVHVALWTLEQNGISNSPAITFDAPYSDSQPKIQAVRDYLNTLPEEKLSALDQRLAYHWRIYSPIWSSHDWP